MNTLTPRDAALAAHAAGISVLPPKEDGSKAPDTPEWKSRQERPTTSAELDGWYGQHAGVGWICGPISGDLEVIDFDDELTYRAFWEAAISIGLGDLVERIESGYLEQSPNGRHWPYYCEQISGNIKLARRLKRPEEMADANDKIKTLIETRGEGGYIITAPTNGKVHPAGGAYILLAGSPATIATITPDEREALFELARSFDQMPKATFEWPTVKQDTGWLVRPGDDFNQRADWADVLEEHGWSHCYDRGEVSYWRRPGKDRGLSATTNWAGSGLLYVFSSSTEFDSERGYSKFAAYTILEHDSDFKLSAGRLADQGYGTPAPKEQAVGYGVDQATGEVLRGDASTGPFRPQWPEPLKAEAFHGPLGRFVRAIEPYTEADSAALLAHVLSGTSALLGPNVRAVAGDAEHPPRINAVVVGETSKGRKGSAARPVERALKSADGAFSGRISEGLSSGEGLIWAVRDPVEKYERTGRGEDRRSELVTVDPGIQDKRLWVLESEFASTLRVAQREGNTITTTVRRAWDSGDLRTLVKNNPAVATGAHIAITGHVTRDELLRYLDRSEFASGFANRFLWFCARRSRCLPHGARVPSGAIETFADEVRTARAWATGSREISWNHEAAAAWEEIYPDLSEGQPGMFGAATSRAEAQVLRLAVLYAVLDLSDEIQEPHLLAGLAVWEFAEASARWIFGDSTGNPYADAILSALRHGSPLDRTAISSLFGRNISQAHIEQALALLLKAGLARVTRVETGGRPREEWHAA